MYNFDICLARFVFTENLDIKGVKINAAGIPYAAAAYYWNAAETNGIYVYIIYLCVTE